MGGRNHLIKLTKKNQFISLKYFFTVSTSAVKEVLLPSITNLVCKLNFLLISLHKVNLMFSQDAKSENLKTIY